MKDTTAILDIAYKHIEPLIKKNLNEYKKCVSRFINSRADDLYSNAPYHKMYFSETDILDFYKSTGINRDVIKNAISNTYYADISNFNPSYAKDDFVVSMICIIRYLRSKNDKKNLDLALIHLSCSGKYYTSIFHASFPTFDPQEHIMEYVVTNMANNKFDIVREGNVIGAMKSISTTWSNTYGAKFKDFHDDDVVYLIQQLHNRIKSFMNNIAELYYKAYEDKDLYITYDSDDVSENNYHLADSDSFKLERIVSSTMNSINTHGVNQLLCKTASNDLVKVNELKSIIENILNDNKNIPLIKEFITLLVVCYFQQSKTKDVRDLDFITFSLKVTPNTKDPYVLRQKEVLNLLLMNNSEHFNRRKSRKATEQAYFRAITAYFAMLIQESMK